MLPSHHKISLDNSDFTVYTPHHFTFYLIISVFTTAMLLCFLSINAPFSLLLSNNYADLEYGSYQLMLLYADYASFLFKNASCHFNCIEHVATTCMMIIIFFKSIIAPLSLSLYNNNFADYSSYLTMLLSHYYCKVTIMLIMLLTTACSFLLLSCSSAR